MPSPFTRSWRSSSAAKPSKCPIRITRTTSKRCSPAITPRTRQVFIANPNNPTGTLVGQEEIDRFMERVPEHVLVIFDEAYHEFLDNPPDVVKFVREGRNVVVMRTFSKIQGLANLRIGYGLAPREIAEVLQKDTAAIQRQWHRQAGAIAGLQDEEHMRKTRELTHEGRELFESEFRALGLEYVPSFANFVLVNVGDGDAVFQALLKRGIIVRAMRSYKLPAWIRVSVGTMGPEPPLHRGSEDSCCGRPRQGARPARHRGGGWDVLDSDVPCALAYSIAGREGSPSRPSNESFGHVEARCPQIQSRTARRAIPTNYLRACPRGVYPIQIEKPFRGLRRRKEGMFFAKA